jgi:hypothetical protein
MPVWHALFFIALMRPATSAWTFPRELYAEEFPRALRYGGMRDQILV